MIKVKHSSAYSSPKRGIFLEILLGVILLDGIAKVYGLFLFLFLMFRLESFNEVLIANDIPIWALFFQSLNNVLLFFFLWKTWKWKRLGIYGLGIIMVVSLIINFIVYRNIMSVMPWFFVMGLAYYFQIKPLFKYFT